MTLDNKQEERVREAFAALTDATPVGVEFEELTDTHIATPKVRLSGGLVFGSAFAVVAVLGVIVWAMLGQAGPADTDLAGQPSDAAEATFPPPVDDATPDAADATFPPPLDDPTAESFLDHIPERPVMGPFSDSNPPTFEEYEQAVLWTVACIESLGVPMYDFGLDSEVERHAAPSPGIPASKVYIFAGGDPAPGAPAGSAGHASDFCGMLLLDQVGPYYFASPTQVELDLWYEELRTCLVEAEVDDIDGIFGIQHTDDGKTYWNLAEAERVPIDCWP